MQKFDTATPITAVLNVPAGRIRLIAADRADTTIEVRPANASKGRDVKAAEQTEVDFRDGVLRIAAPAAKNKVLGPAGSVEVTVQLPAGSHIEAEAAGAEFRAVGRFGDVTVDGGYGPQDAIRIDEAESLRATAFSGDVSVGRLSGSAEVSNQKGDIRIAEAVRGTVVLTTQMGDVTIGAARGTSAALDAGTGHGRIDNALKNTDGTPGLTVRATTAYGDITARSL